MPPGTGEVLAALRERIDELDAAMTALGHSVSAEIEPYTDDLERYFDPIPNATYTGPFAGRVTLDGSTPEIITVLNGTFEYGSQSESFGSSETVNLKDEGYTSDTVYLWVEFRYGSTANSLVLMHSTSSVGSSYSGDVFARQAIGHATVNAGGLITSWTQTWKYGNIRRERYEGYFVGKYDTTGAGRLYIGNGNPDGDGAGLFFWSRGGGAPASWIAEGYLDLAGASVKPGKYSVYVDISNPASLTKAFGWYDDTAHDPEDIVDACRTMLGYAHIDSNGDLTAWQQVHHGAIYVNQFDVFDIDDAETSLITRYPGELQGRVTNSGATLAGSDTVTTNHGIATGA